MGPLVFLLKLAWDCRMQLDIDIQMRQIPRPRPIQIPPVDVIPINDNEIRDILNDSMSESSWTTVEEQDMVSDVDTD
ncbi:hypothetical protein GWI33_019662 [Rhynchophorus ferrugineus]|uniref:Uncharacterized protein n=1 Tax=Rhynchophorus ferrugineus TaxID=354439 RepID=A0A834M6S0_RHYFE|nr:hypothetical protein GWI33_019662 [Rhynchophorus ferrugineus]